MTSRQLWTVLNQNMEGTLETALDIISALKGGPIVECPLEELGVPRFSGVPAHVSPFCLAIYTLREDVVTALLATYGGAEAISHTSNKNKLTPLHIASICGHAPITKVLLEYGADVSATSKDNFIPLHYATTSRDLPTIKLLIEADSDVSAVDNEGTTPLLLAADYGDTRAIYELISAGADIEHADHRGFTALAIAADAGHENAVRLLLAFGASVESTTTRRLETPLHLACFNGETQIMALLLAAGASVNEYTDEGWTPLTIVSTGAEVTLLLDNGADINELAQMWSESNAHTKKADYVAVLQANGVITKPA